MALKVVRITDDILKDPLLKRKIYDFFHKRINVDNPPKAPVVFLDTPCHKWTGARDGKYGLVLVTLTKAGITYRRRAHIVSYMLHNGQVTDEERVCHLCQEELCVRPDHLVLGNPALNATHALMNRNTSSPYNKSWKLTTKEVKQIRNLYYRYNFAQKKLSGMFGVTQTTISKIINYKTWKI